VTLAAKRTARETRSIGAATNYIWTWPDGQIPISAVLTSASLHDSQVAIPLATMTTQRVTYCYELMDSATTHTTLQSRAARWGTAHRGSESARWTQA